MAKTVLAIFIVGFTVGPALAEPAIVLRVIDGDTYALVFPDGRRETMRLGGWIDTPETGEQAKCALERERGYAATARVSALLTGKAVDVVVEPVRDKYKRLVASVSIGGVDLAEILRAEGLAKPFSRSRQKPDWCK